jgi:hypothetical protein
MEKVRLWLDDVRPMPLDFQVHAKTVREAKKVLRSGRVEFISFDHDLGEGPTGYDLACWIESEVFEGTFSAPAWEIHSSNPVGRRMIESAMLSAQRWIRREDD